MSTPSAALADAAPQSKLGAFSRIVGVFFDPKETFKDIAAAPTWIVPVVLLVVLSTITCVALNQRMDWRSYMSQQIEKSPQAANMSPEQKEQRIEGGVKVS